MCYIEEKVLTTLKLSLRSFAERPKHVFFKVLWNVADFQCQNLLLGNSPKIDSLVARRMRLEMLEKVLKLH